MGARIHTADEERILGLRPLPDLPCPGPAESRALNLQYEVARKLYRQKHPDHTKGETPR